MTKATTADIEDLIKRYRVDAQTYAANARAAESAGREWRAKAKRAERTIEALQGVTKESEPATPPEAVERLRDTFKARQAEAKSARDRMRLDLAPLSAAQVEQLQSDEK